MPSGKENKMNRDDGHPSIMHETDRDHAVDGSSYTCSLSEADSNCYESLMSLPCSPNFSAEDTTDIQYTMINQQFAWNTLQRSEHYERPHLIEEYSRNNQRIRKALEIEDKNGNKIITVGTKLTIRARRALFALLSLYAKTGYEGNAEDGCISFKPADYYRAYGVPKTKSKRGKMEFHGNAKKEAINGIFDLMKPFFWYIKEPVRVKGKGKQFNVDVRVEAVVQMFSQTHRRMSEEQADSLTETGHTKNRPSAFMLKMNQGVLTGSLIPFEGDFLIRIQNLFPHAPVHFYDFITFLHIQANFGNQRETRKISSLAVNMHLDNYLRKREGGRVRKYLEEDFKKAKELGYLTDYRFFLKGGEDCVDLFLNKKSFYKGKKERRISGEPPLSVISKDIKNNASAPSCDLSLTIRGFGEALPEK